ncbi:hypothetical protein [Clostridium perfringens]|uniref:hypothetical protein n=1 Tax=Clostridium perfringens TaxID=1502 RepID=UPI00096ABE77|nr:hypothetical protein [Clostridium perfringens]MDK0717058.1 hypothetical protein [Clostridium perfringens]UBK99708.1 hypothetical protein KLF26_10915 [Clostridium perfringens]
MLTPGGKLTLGLIGVITTLYLSYYFIYECIEEKEVKKSFKYLLLSIGNMLSLLFIANMI